MTVKVIPTVSTHSSAGAEGRLPSPSIVVVVDDSDRTGRLLFQGMPRAAAASDDTIVPCAEDQLEKYIQTAKGDVLAGIMNATMRNLAKGTGPAESFESMDEAIEYVFTTLWSGND